MACHQNLRGAPLDSYEVEVVTNPISITLSDERLRKLKEIAVQLNITPEELARVGVEDLLNRPEASFAETLDHVLEKNVELYRRLA